MLGKHPDDAHHHLCSFMQAVHSVLLPKGALSVARMLFICSYVNIIQFTYENKSTFQCVNMAGYELQQLKVLINQIWMQQLSW